MTVVIENHGIEQATLRSGGPDGLPFEIPTTAPRDRFTAHIFACLLALAVEESQATGISVGEALGLCADELDALLTVWAPAARGALGPQPPRIDFDEEEDQLRALFHRYCADGSREALWLAPILARRCMSPNHLWQDLGLPSRNDLNRLMQERFPALAARNCQNMKWKKFFYRCLCEMEGFTLCAAPTCAECNDFSSCFGEENGISRLAHADATNAASTR